MNSTNAYHKNMLIEKFAYHPLIKRRVMIKQNSSEFYWYSSHIGKVFYAFEIFNYEDCVKNINCFGWDKSDVEKAFKENYFIREDQWDLPNLIGDLVSKEDCEVLQ